MLEQLSNAIKFFAFFTSAKVGKTGLTVTVDIYNPAGSLVVSAGSASAVGGGLYSYNLSSGSVSTEGEYTAIFKTADTTVDQQHIPALWVVGRAGVEDLDATVSSRSSHTANNVRDAILTDATRFAGANVDGTISSRASQTSVDDIPTNAEFAAAFAAGDDAVLAAIAALHNLSSAGAQAAAAAALAAYGAATAAGVATRASQASVDDLPTNAEFAATIAAADDAVLAAIGALNNPSAAATAAAVWSYVVRTLTQSAAQVAAAVDGATITILRGDTLTASLTDVGSLTGRTKLWFTAKRWGHEADTEALIQIEETGGLLRLNGAAPGVGQTGSIVVTDAGDGDLTITLSAAAVAALAPREALLYDIQILTAGGVITRATGEASVVADVTRAVA